MNKRQRKKNEKRARLLAVGIFESYLYSPLMTEALEKAIIEGQGITHVWYDPIGFVTRSEPLLISEIYDIDKAVA